MIGRDSRARLRPALLIASALLGCLSLTRVPGVTEVLAYLGPAALVLLLLSLGHYPGEGVLLALGRPARPARAGPIGPRAERVCALMPRGGGLLGAALAGRAPPPCARLHRGQIRSSSARAPEPQRRAGGRSRGDVITHKEEQTT
jgi:hypothetical protein